MYNAFISYSHAADGKLAPALQAALEKFAKPWYKVRYLNIFRDEASLTASPHLWSNIQKALEKSEYLIYMASPISASSKWIIKEIEYWLEHKSIETLLIVLTDGEITWDDKLKTFVNKSSNSLPEILENSFNEEPFYIDLRTARTQEDVSLNNPIFKKEVLKLAAQLHGTAPKDLASEEVFAHRKMIRVRNSAIGVLALLLFIAIGLAWFANRKANEATINLTLANKNANEAKTNLKQAELNQLKADSAADVAMQQRDSAVFERKQAVAAAFIAETQKRIANQRTLEVTAQKDLNLRQLTNIYWSEGQKERDANNDLNASLFLAEAIKINKDSLPGESLRSDIESCLPKVSLLNIMSFALPIDNASFSVDGKNILLHDNENGIASRDVLTGKEVSTLNNYRSYEEDRPYNSSISHDNKKILTIGNENTLQLLDIETKKQLTTKLTSKDYVRRIIFSANSKRILLLGDSLTSIWNVDVNKLLTIPKKIQYSDLIAVFSPSSEQVLIVDSKTVRMLNSATGKEIRNTMNFEEEVVDASFSYDGRQFMTTTDKFIQIWDAFTCKLLKTITSEPGSFSGSTFSPDGKKILTRTSDYEAAIYDVNSGKSIGSLTGHNGYISRALFSPDGKMILTSSYDQTVCLWSAKTLEQIGGPIKHESLVYNAIFSPDSKKILTITAGNTGRLWQIGRYSPVTPYYKNNDVIQSAAYSSDGQKILIASKNVARLLDAENCKAFGSPMAQNSISYSVFSLDAKKIITASPDGSASLWDANTGRRKASINHINGMLSCVFSPDSKKILTCGKDMTIRLWDAETGRAVSAPMKHDACVVSASFSFDGAKIVSVSSKNCDGDFQKNPDYDFPTHAGFSPDGKNILTTGYDFEARIWETNSAKMIGAVIKPESGYGIVTPFALRDDANHPSMSVFNATIQLWDAETGNLKAYDFAHSESISNALFSPKGNQILVYGKNGIARLWIKTSAGAMNGILLKHNDDITGGVFSQDGEKVLTSSKDNMARLWEAKSGEPIGPAMNLNCTIQKAVFNDDGSRILTIGDSSIRIWLTGTGKPIGPVIKLKSEIYNAYFHPDGKHALVSSSDSTVRIFEFGGDLDIPSDLLELQIEVSTGWQLNTATNEIEVIPFDQWIKLKKKYDADAAYHYQVCKYHRYNFWKRFPITKV